MDEATARPTAEEHIKFLEEALAEYAWRYGLTEGARALLVGSPPPIVVANTHTKLTG